MKSRPSIESLILTIQGQRVFPAADLATIYGVETGALTQAVKRNPDRFPADFTFRLSPEGFAELKSQGAISSDGRAALTSLAVILKRGQHAKFPPYACTEHGANMVATVLKSQEAVP